MSNSTDLTIKSGDTRLWTFTLSDADSSALTLVGATVEFNLRETEGGSSTFFDRNTGGTGSDFISISSPASDGILTITPTASDWSEISDNYGVYVGEFKVTDTNSIIQYTTDFIINIQQSLVT